MSAIVTEPEDVPGWYYRQIEALPIRRGDCPGIYHTAVGPFQRAVLIPEPQDWWTMEVAAEQVEEIKADLARPARKLSGNS